MSDPRPIELVFLWHHHQPDYRNPRDRGAQLPWVRLHATKDYLDMARHLAAHPGVRATFNFVPSLIDQIEDAIQGAPDALFDLLRKPIASLTHPERELLVRRCAMAPRSAFEQWPGYRRLCERRGARSNGPSDADLAAMQVWFLLAWLDPIFHDRPEARSALVAGAMASEVHRDGLLALHDQLLGEVVPAYRELAAAGQIELAASPYYHPILPLVIDLQSARRARPEMALPSEPFAAPEDARHQVRAALARHASVFVQPPTGMWPSEGSVSPEAAAVIASHGIRWIGSDEGVLWQSLPPELRRREALYRPWRFATPDGEIALFFRDRELSDRIGFVYHHWKPADAVADFLTRIRRIAHEHPADETPVVSVILDGENCWEYYAADGGPFLDALYTALEGATDIHTRTPSEILASGRSLPLLPHLHSGSWINADFRIWIGHPEKNRAWELVSRARRALVEHGIDREQNPAAWESLAAAQGSDWFWWFGDDHYTADKSVFDRLFREHLRGVYERADLESPGWLQIPVASPRAPRGERNVGPIEFIHPVVDGRRTDFYEWNGAGHHALASGGSSMHRGAGETRDLYFGFDAECLYLRLDFTTSKPPGADVDLTLEILTPRPARLVLRGLSAGSRRIDWDGGDQDGREVQGSRAVLGAILEVALPFASLGLAAGEQVEILGQLARDGQTFETVPAEDLVRFEVPDGMFEVAMWSA